MNQTTKDKINWQYSAIQEQLVEQNDAAHQAREDEHAQDVACLRDTAQIQQAENAQRYVKEIKSKQNFKNAWQEQMAYRQLHEQTNKLFY